MKAVTNSRCVSVLRRAGGGVPTRADTVITSRLNISAVSPPLLPVERTNESYAKSEEMPRNGRWTDGVCRVDWGG